MDKIFSSADDPVYRIIKKHLGYDYLFPHQIFFISLILEAAGFYGEERAAESSRKNLAILPTGAGKSACFMIPVLVLGGLSVIVYPLKALISDQLERFTKAGIASAAFHGGMDAAEKQSTLESIKSGSVNAVLVNPEAFKNEQFFLILRESGVKCVYIDEAHTVSEWGETFRPACLEMGIKLAELDDVIITALTATAGDHVLAGIIKTLFPGGDAHILRGNPNKPNIHYSVIHTLCKDNSLKKIMEKVERPLIVFCSSRTGTEMTALMLSRHFEKENVRFYHAGLNREEKAAVEDWFRTCSSGILCATCAFGLGIDISGIRTVIHYTMPPTPEAFLQETGRGGRDGNTARSFTLISPSDIPELRKQKAARSIGLLGMFMEMSCRRSAVLYFFGTENIICTGCDVCDGTAMPEPENYAEILRWLSYSGGYFSYSETVRWFTPEREIRVSHPLISPPPFICESIAEARELLYNLWLLSKKSSKLMRNRCSFLEKEKKLIIDRFPGTFSSSNAA